MSRAAIWGNLILISTLWGASFPLVRFVVAEMSPLAMTAARGCIAAVALGLFLWATRAKLSGFGQVWRHALVLGVMNGLVPNILNGMALQRIESLPGALVQATTPIFIRRSSLANRRSTNVSTAETRRTSPTSVSTPLVREPAHAARPRT